MPTYHLTHVELRDTLDKLLDDPTEKIVSVDSAPDGTYTMVTEIVAPMTVKDTIARKGYSVGDPS